MSSVQLCFKKLGTWNFWVKFKFSVIWNWEPFLPSIQRTGQHDQFVLLKLTFFLVHSDL